MSTYPYTHWFICFLALLGLSGLTGCMHSPDEEVNMPPSPPSGERIQSEVFPPEPTSRPTSPPAVKIILLLENTPVLLENLERATLPGEQTVVIRVDPATPYKEVVTIMDQLHDLGFLIQFQSDK